MKLQLVAYKEKQDDVLFPTHDTRPAYEEHGIDYGYGFFSWGNGSFGHGGDMDGFGSDYSINPELQKGYVVLTSYGGRWIGQFSREIGKILYK